MGSENNMVAVRDLVESIARPFPDNCNWEDQARACQTVAQLTLARLAQPYAQQGEIEELRAEVERLRGLLVDPGSPPWEDARAILVDELRKIGFDTHADNVAAGEGVLLPSYVALNLIALCHRAQQGASSPASGEGVAIPAGMKSHDGKGEPSDWDWDRNGATILCRDGQLGSRLPHGGGKPLWSGWIHQRSARDIIAYTPLAAATQPAVPQEDAVERAARAMCEADGLDLDEEIVGGQATGFENYGPLWQAEDRSEGQLGLTNYKRLARAALQGDAAHTSQEKGNG